MSRFVSVLTVALLAAAGCGGDSRTVDSVSRNRCRADCGNTNNACTNACTGTNQSTCRLGCAGSQLSCMKTCEVQFPDVNDSQCRYDCGAFESACSNSCTVYAPNGTDCTGNSAACASKRTSCQQECDGIYK